MASTVSGKIAFVTGGGSGIGAALATELVRGGAEVWIADRQIGPAQELAQRLSSSRTLRVEAERGARVVEGVVVPGTPLACVVAATRKSGARATTSNGLDGFLTALPPRT